MQSQVPELIIMSVFLDSRLIRFATLSSAFSLTLRQAWNNSNSKEDRHNPYQLEISFLINKLFVKNEYLYCWIRSSPEYFDSNMWSISKFLHKGNLWPKFTAIFKNCAHINAKNSIHLKFTSLADFTSCSSINYLDFIWQSFFSVIYMYLFSSLFEKWYNLLLYTSQNMLGLLRGWCPVWCNNWWVWNSFNRIQAHSQLFFLHHACVFLDEFLIFMKTVVWKLIILQW